MRKMSLVLACVAAVSLAWAAFAAEPADSERTSDHPILDRIDKFGRSIFGGGESKPHDDKDKADKDRDTKRDSNPRASRAGVNRPSYARSGASQADGTRSSSQPERVARANTPADRISERSTEAATTPPRAGSAWSGDSGMSNNSVTARPGYPGSPGSQRAGGEKIYNERVISDRPISQQPADERTGLPLPATERPSLERSTADRASSPRSVVERAPAERSAAVRSDVERPTADSSRPPVLRPATEAADASNTPAPRTTAPAATQAAGDSESRAAMRPTGANALHQRLSGFRHSAFDEQTPAAGSNPSAPTSPASNASTSHPPASNPLVTTPPAFNSPATNPTAADTAPRSREPAAGVAELRSGVATEQPAVRVAAAPREPSTAPTLRQPSTIDISNDSQGPQATLPTPAAAAGAARASSEPRITGVTARPPVAGAASYGTAGFRAAPNPTRSRGALPAPAVVETTAPGAAVPRDTAAADTAAPTGDAAASSARPNGDNVLFTRQSPVIQVETIGARKISVGKESAYEVLVRNSGGVAAEQVAVTIDLPEWIDVLAAEASTGSTSSEKAKEGVGEFRWKVGRIEAKARERLVLRIVPRQNRPFDLAVRWSHTPALSQAMIEVQEAKLNLALHGPKEVLYGKGELYRLEVANAGNGDAENVVISLLPSTPGDKQPPASYKLGTVSAGQKKTIDIELTARQTGELAIHVEARGDADVKAQLSEKIVVRRGSLKIDVEAPKVQFVGSDATYRIRVSNPGTAPAVNPTVTALIPAGTKFLGSPQKPQIASDRSRVTWMLETLPPGGETTVTMSCDATTPGVSKLEVQAAAEGDLAASNTASTQVEAVASLALKVDDPAGPVAIESEGVYTLTVENRGTAAAEGVEVVGFFSNGFEPAAAEGGRYRIVPGQIIFERIASLGAGQNAQLKIRAKATAPGNHIFRVEVRSDAGNRLVREGTTRYYGDAAAGGATRAVAQPKDGQQGQPGGSQAGTDRTAVRPESAPRSDNGASADPSMRPAANPNDNRPQSR